MQCRFPAPLSFGLAVTGCVHQGEDGPRCPRRQAALRRKIMVTCDGAGASQELVKELGRLAARHGYQVTYSAGWALGARERAAIGNVPEAGWEMAVDGKGEVRERRSDDACADRHCAHRACWTGEAHVAEPAGLRESPGSGQPEGQAMGRLVAARDWLTVFQLPACASELSPVEWSGRC
jgi:hypothetical protein